jgi:regulatory protein
MVRRISGLKVQKRNPQRVNVYLEGDFAFGLSRIVAAWLSVGQDLTEDKIHELLEHDAIEVAYQQSVKFIGYRMRTISEVEKYLTKKGVEAQIIATVTDKLVNNGLLNDENFAEMWIENRAEFRPRSHRMLAFELKRKGVKSEIIQSVIENTTPENELAYLAARKRIRQYEHLEWQDFQQKLGSYLARRGFSYSTIKPTVEQIWIEINQEDSTLD